MFSKCKPLILLSGTSIVLAVTIWPILCYNFVLNSMHLTMTALALSRSTTYGNVDDIEESGLGIVALTFTMLSGIIISEGILVVCLVFQFMSSFDFLTGDGQECEDNWWRCHRKVLLLTSVVLTIKLSVSFFFLTYSTIFNNDSLLELYAIAVNFIFLVITVNVAALSVAETQSSQVMAADQMVASSINPTHDSHHIINVPTFLDRPPAYSDLENVDKIPIQTT